jgi:hypothetical protein
MGTGGESFHPNPRDMTTSNIRRTFIVQIVGIDAEGQGPSFYSEAEANEYATQATANGFQAVITSY